MKFQSLYKLFAIDESACKDIYLSRFNSEATLKFFVDINSYPSFFFYHTEINTLVYKIRDLDYRVSKLFDSLPSVAKTQYIKKSLIDEIHFSNKHCNILVNDENGSCYDVILLVKLIKDTIKKQLDINLKEELIIY